MYEGEKDRTIILQLFVDEDTLRQGESGVAERAIKRGDVCVVRME